MLTREESCQVDPTHFITSGYIGGMMTSDTRDQCPWTLNAQDGQRIQVRLVGFYSTRSRDSRITSDLCVQLGSVVDELQRGPLSVCGGRDVIERDKILYTSTSSRIELSLLLTSPDDVYLIYYQGMTNSMTSLHY